MEILGFEIIDREKLFEGVYSESVVSSSLSTLILLLSDLVLLDTVFESCQSKITATKRQRWVKSFRRKEIDS